MAGLENLASIIYHEKQQPGSMLCAQHAINSLLQGNYFTAPDLSELAENLDSLERSYRDDDTNTAVPSRNMDDTGFFSVQVLDNALKVWGLNLVRWRGEEMRPYQDHPHTQLAFILNLEQHWFTLRRFGSARPNLDEDRGDGHWFNLNSFSARPEWIGKLYLGMVLQQAEAEGYSVFAVTQADPNAPLALPRTEADDIASTLPEPSSSRTQYDPQQSRTIKPNTTNSKSDSRVIEGLEDEDYELQAALQASLAGSGHIGSISGSTSQPNTTGPQPLSTQHALSEASGSQYPIPQRSLNHPTQAPMNFNPSSHADVDPVTASMERNRVMLRRMREQQEFAQQELMSDIAMDPDEAAAVQARRERRRQEEEEEAAQLKQALEESQALAEQHSKTTSKLKGTNEEPAVMRTQGTHGLSPIISNSRLYDDDDAELQAALEASLGNVPVGYEHYGLHSPNTSHHSTNRNTDDLQSIASDDTNFTEGPTQDAPVEVDEIRKRRLARFGG